MTADSEKIRVLYVDGNPDDASVVVEQLERASVSLTVHLATDGQTALTELAAVAVDCVVSRYELPDANGVEVLQEVRERFGSIPFVLFVRDGSEEIASDAISAGITEYLQYDTATEDGETLAHCLKAVVDIDPADGRGEPLETYRWTRTLAAVNRMAERIEDSESKASIATAAVETLRESLAESQPVIALYDAEANSLAPAHDVDADRVPVDLSHLLDRPDAIGWEAFVDSERHLEPLSDVPSGDQDLPSGRVATWPLGRHGVFICVDTGHPTGIVPIPLLEAAVLTIRAAFDRVDLEDTSRDRGRRLHEKNRQVDQLSRLLTVTRRVNRALVRKSTYRELNTAVCRVFPEMSPYRYAWIGTYDAVADVVSPREFAGTTDDFLASITDTEGHVDTGPAVRAARHREPVVVESVFSDPPLGQWQKTALANGYRSLISLPLVFDDSLHGVLSVFSSQEATFDDRERAVFEDLGEGIASAFADVKRKQALVSDTVVDLEFRAAASDRPLVGLTLDADGTLELNGLVPTADDEVRAYVTVTGVSRGWVESNVDESTGFADPTVLPVGGEEYVFEYTVTEESIIHTALEHGGIPQRIEAVDDECRIEVTLPKPAAVREFVEGFQSTHTELELHACREHERTVQTRGKFLIELADRLTDRQREVLERAYFSGFFESPRPVTGEDIAASLDITQSTFSHHLRVAQAKVFSLLLEEMDAPV